MNRLSEKVFLHLDSPTEETPGSDQARLEKALEQLGYAGVEIPLKVLRKLYPICREAEGITVTLVFREEGITAVSLERGDTRGRHYGLAVDYGSTTILMELVDLNSGRVIATKKTENGQIAFGTDILTRITYCLECDAHKDEIRQATTETFRSLMEGLEEETGLQISALPVMVISGNTTMIHFLLGLDAWTVFASPFSPVTTNPGWFWGKELEMDFSGMVYIIPSASNYVGGDIVSGLLTLEMQKSEEITLFFDIGTNGELVLGNKDWIVAGAGAAGPALEGYISRYGMRANPGAIDHVKITDNILHYTTIDGKAPVGICGSGIIDLLAEMRLAGWLDISGRLNPDKTDKIIYLPEEAQFAAVYADAEESALGTPLFFTQTDISQYCETKAAAFTMIECMLESVGCTEQDIGHFHLSGAFPAHSDLESAITIGMFPDLPREKFGCTPNTSLDGAKALLLNRELQKKIRHLRENMYCMQFASVPDFLIKMQAAKFIPHTNLERFPSVREKLGI